MRWSLFLLTSELMKADVLGADFVLPVCTFPFHAIVNSHIHDPNPRRDRVKDEISPEGRNSMKNGQTNGNVTSVINRIREFDDSHTVEYSILSTTTDPSWESGSGTRAYIFQIFLRTKQKRRIGFLYQTTNLIIIVYEYYVQSSMPRSVS